MQESVIQLFLYIGMFSAACVLFNVIAAVDRIVALLRLRGEK